MVEAVNGPVVTVSTPQKTIQRHRNQVEKYMPASATSTIRSKESPQKDGDSSSKNAETEEPLRRFTRVICPSKWLEGLENEGEVVAIAIA